MDHVTAGGYYHQPMSGHSEALAGLDDSEILDHSGGYDEGIHHGDHVVVRKGDLMDQGSSYADEARSRKSYQGQTHFCATPYRLACRISRKPCTCKNACSNLSGSRTDL